MSNVRDICVELLTNVEKNQAYSTVAFQNVLQKHKLDVRDRGLLTELFYGTIQRKLTLDFYLKPFIEKQKKMELWVLSLLRMTVYQMAYLDRVPDHAAIFEAVQIAKKRGHQGIAKFVNGVLRNVQRSGFDGVSSIKDERERLSVEFSMPRWIVELLFEQYGEVAREIFPSLNIAPHLSARIQNPEMSVEEVQTLLREEGVMVQESKLSPRAVIVEEGDLLGSKAFKDGIVTVQDESSSLVAQVGKLQPRYKVLDTCAAPGGKTTHFASYLAAEEGGLVEALDLHENKLRKIHQNAKRLGVEDRIHTHALDARKVGELFEKESFDAVFVDAPCSGLGLMRRKPDIKYTKNSEDLTKLQIIQLEILASVATMVKNSGKLIYSTCTINKSENEEVVLKFLANHPDFELQPIEEFGCTNENPMLTILPHEYHTDGFFIARMVRK